MAARECPWEIVCFQICKCLSSSRKLGPNFLDRAAMAELGLYSRLCGRTWAGSYPQLFLYSSPFDQGPLEAWRQIAFVHIRWRLWGFEQEFSAFCLLSLGVRDGGDNRVMYECRVNKAACGCDDMFLLSAMRSSSRELQGCAFNLLCNWQL